jgi:hypothetical protein
MTQVPFESLPQRVFLDSSTLQMLQDYGGQVWDNEPIPDNDRIHSIPDGPATIDALRRIFFVNQRALWQFALSANSLREVAAKGDARYLQWAYDVLDHWQICLEESGPPSSKGQTIGAMLMTTSFNYLSEGDRSLLLDAVTLECDAFLTCDRKLAKNRHHLLAELAILVVTPIQHWQMLEPWARLYV